MADKTSSKNRVGNRKIRQAVVLVGLLAVTTGCSVAEEESVDETTTVETTVPETTTSTTTTLVVATTEDESESSETTTELNPFGGDDPEDMLMPDVLCMNLQAAQDEIQDRGVFFSRSEDATGQGRRQILDSGWIVVKQSPAPGQPIGELEAVLSVVKIGESTGGVC